MCAGQKVSTRWSAATAALAVILLFFVPGFTGPGGVSVSPAWAAAAVEPPMVPASFSELAAAVGPAVVNIRTVKTLKGGGPVFRHFQREPGGRENPFNDFFERFFGDEMQREFKQPSLGSGFIIDKDGYVVTNNHVIEDADQIKVKLGDENEFDAKVIGRDPSTDLALLKIKSNSHDFPVLKLGDSDAAQGRPVGGRHRQPLRPGAHRDRRHRQRQGPA